MPNGKHKESEAEVVETEKARPTNGRRRMTPAERIARAEAELAKAKEKAEADAKKAETKVREQLDKLVARRDELNVKIAELEAQLPTEPVDTQVTES
jgi:F0F1-type ATP synthase membrane subunit b/b'